MFRKACVGLSVILLSLTLKAAPTPLKAWTATSSTVSNAVDTVQALIASANSGDPQGTTSSGQLVGSYRGPAYATFIQVISDTAANKLQLYQATNQIKLFPTNALSPEGSNYVGAGGTNFGCSYVATNIFGTNVFYGPSSSNLIQSNAVCVIRHTAGDSYERNRIWGIYGTNVIFQYPPSTTIGAGDIVYVYTPTAAIAVPTNNAVLLNAKQGITTFTQSGPPGVVSGVVPNTPLLMEITGATLVNTNVINAAGGYLP